MFIKVIIIFLSVIFLVFTANAQTQTEINNRTCSHAKKTEDKMNRMYQQILQEYKEDTVFIEKFTKSQKAWLAYREAQIEAISPTRAENLRGSAYSMCLCTNEEIYSLQRIKELQPWIEGQECCDVCGESYKEKVKMPKNKNKIRKKTK